MGSTRGLPEDDTVGLTTIHLTTRGLIRGLVTDIDDHFFHVEVTDHCGARGLMAKAVDGVVPVPRTLVLWTRTTPAKSPDGRYPLKGGFETGARFSPDGWAWQEVPADGGVGAECRCPASDQPGAELWPFYKQAEVVTAGEFELQADGIEEPGYVPPYVVRYRENGYCKKCAPGGRDR